MKNKKIITIIGVITTLAGAGLTLVSDWANDKKMKEEIAEKVEEGFRLRGL